LLDELSASPPNVLRIRALCRDFPGLISSAGVRVRVWTLLLMGPEAGVRHDVLPMPTEPAGEQHVLEADVRRTRSEVEQFRSDRYRTATQHLLQLFCVRHRLLYKQGMNEVVAPFIALCPPPKGNAMAYALFEAFLYRYLQRFLCVDESAFLFRAFRLFHVLCLYHEPTLAHHLQVRFFHLLLFMVVTTVIFTPLPLSQREHFPPELYAPSWLLTL
jgi:hypothetical protein